MRQTRQVARKSLYGVILIGILLLVGQLFFSQPPAHGAAQDANGDVDRSVQPIGLQQSGPGGDFPGEGELGGLGDETWRMLKEGQKLDTKELHGRIKCGDLPAIPVDDDRLFLVRLEDIESVPRSTFQAAQDPPSAPHSSLGLLVVLVLSVGAILFFFLVTGAVFRI